MPNDPQPPSPGKYVVYDRITPPLKAGDYELVVEQEIKSDLKTPPSGITTQFRVTGPRFKLHGGEVHMEYPPKDLPNSPTYSNVPFVTLQTRTLPWTHSPFVGTEAPAQFGANISTDISDYPSMMLLVVKKSEIMNSNDTLGIHTGEDGLEVGTILSGAISRGLFVEDETELVNYLEINADTLNAIAPTLDEALLLAHARQVNPVDKEACGTDEDGWFSVVLSNRVLEPGHQYFACLVSIEGRLADGVMHHHVEQAFSGKSSPSSLQKTSASLTKLVLLHQWKFRSAEEGGDFESRMQNLNVRVSSSGNTTFEEGQTVAIKDLVNTDAEIEPLLLGNDSVPGMTDNSYLLTQLNHVDGIPEDALYRGPAIAVPEDHIVKSKPYDNSDEALAYVDELGIWDISHSAAFELGRLMALSDASFTKNLRIWIAKDIQQRKLELTKENLRIRGIAKDIIASKLESISASIPDLARNIRVDRVINYIHDDYDSVEVAERLAEDNIDESSIPGDMEPEPDLDDVAGNPTAIDGNVEDAFDDLDSLDGLEGKFEGGELSDP